MALFTKTIETPRDMDNIYKEFEGFFTSSIREVEVEWNEDHTSKHNDFDDIVEKKLLENYFQEIIERINLHLLEQLSKYNQIQLISFIEKQNINIKSFEPEKRKRELYNLYLLENIAFGDDSILKSNYQLREYERLIVTHAYQKYSDAYKSLGIEMEKLFSSFNSN